MPERDFRRLPIRDAYQDALATPAEFAERQREHFRRLRLVATPTGRELLAYVSDSRWVANCDVCNGGLGVVPGEAAAVCWVCGSVFSIRFPEPPQMRAILEVLAPRAPRLRNWFPTAEIARRHARFAPDTPESLAAENELLGLDHHSWTAPRTWTTSEMVTSAIMNTHVRDNLNETGPALASAQGDLLYAAAANDLARLPKGAASYYLRMKSDGTIPEWRSS